MPVPLAGVIFVGILSSEVIFPLLLKWKTCDGLWGATFYNSNASILPRVKFWHCFFCLKGYPLEVIWSDPEVVFFPFFGYNSTLSTEWSVLFMVCKWRKLLPQTGPGPLWVMLGLLGKSEKSQALDSPCVSPGCPIPCGSLPDRGGPVFTLVALAALNWMPLALFLIWQNLLPCVWFQGSNFLLWWFVVTH